VPAAITGRHTPSRRRTRKAQSGHDRGTRHQRTQQTSPQLRGRRSPMTRRYSSILERSDTSVCAVVKWFVLV
jgi:hypothetical protein